MISCEFDIGVHSTVGVGDVSHQTVVMRFVKFNGDGGQAGLDCCDGGRTGTGERVEDALTTNSDGTEKPFPEVDRFGKRMAEEVFFGGA